MHRVENIGLWCAAAIHHLGQGVSREMAEPDVPTTRGVGRQPHPHVGQRPAHQPHDWPRATGIEGGTAFDEGTQGGNVLR